MTAHDDALAAIEARRALVAGRTAGPWVGDAWDGIWNKGNCLVADVFSDEPDAALIVAAVNAFARDTEALAEVLERHAPKSAHVGNGYHGGPKQYRDICRPCGTLWPCRDARAVLSALGVDHE